jgi:hypothetical protein
VQRAKVGPSYTPRARLNPAPMLRLVFAGSILAQLSPVAATGSVAEAHTKSGRWHGVNWELRGGAWRERSFCVAMLINDRESGRRCGNVRRQAESATPEPHHLRDQWAGRPRRRAITAGTFSSVER